MRSSIASRAPDDAVNANVPPALERVIARALEKDRQYPYRALRNCERTAAQERARFVGDTVASAGENSGRA